MTAEPRAAAEIGRMRSRLAYLGRTKSLNDALQHVSIKFLPVNTIPGRHVGNCCNSDASAPVYSVNLYLSITHSATNPSRHVIFLPSL